MLDMHCHVLYGVDDGAKTKEESLDMLNAAKKCGIDKIVFTPHLYDVNQDLSKVLERYKEIITIAADLGIKVKLGFEINWKVIDQVTPEQLEEFRIEDTNSILLELPEKSLLREWQQIILRLARYHNIIIAHPERYIYVQNNPDMVRKFKECGCEIAVDASGMTRGIFGDEWKTANDLVKNGLADYVVSDAHKVEHYKYFQKQLSKIKKLANNAALYDEGLWQ
ncbi:MAG: CpsB/CapC family capsule biosynthesis tyrosine phosphatase [Acutalibacteraceae bacterium]|nr:PHP domain-containing protein [Bacillota bacterium]